jgi:RNA polymerase sigma-70 factor (ECF subfamily)
VTPDPTFADRLRLLTDQFGLPGVDVLGAIFDLTAQRLTRLAVAITRNQYDAEDAVQAVMIRVAARPGLLRDAEAPWAYLLRMVRNEALAVGRSKNRRAAATSVNDLVTRRSVDHLELEDTQRAVWGALRSLPTEQAEVVVLKNWEGLTHSEIAKLLGLSVNTVVSRYQYGLRKLSVCLKRTADEALTERGRV